MILLWLAEQSLVYFYSDRHVAVVQLLRDTRRQRSSTVHVRTEILGNHGPEGPRFQKFWSPGPKDQHFRDKTRSQSRGLISG